jgi:hypothetical protein
MAHLMKGIRRAVLPVTGVSARFLPACVMAGEGPALVKLKLTKMSLVGGVLVCWYLTTRIG